MEDKFQDIKSKHFNYGTVTWQDVNWLLSQHLKQQQEIQDLEEQAGEMAEKHAEKDIIMGNMQQEIERLKQVKEIEVYDNGIANIQYEDGESMLINKVWYMDAVLTGWDEKDVGNKR